MKTVGLYMEVVGLTKEASEKSGGVMFSEPEILLAVELKGRGLEYKQQVRLPYGKTTAVADFIVDGRLIVEVDGRKFHHAPKDSVRDYAMRRDHGLWTLRIPAAHVVKNAEACVSRIALELVRMDTCGIGGGHHAADCEEAT